MNWPDTVAGPGKTQYVWPPFDSTNYQISAAELSRLEKLGFDFLRVTLDPGIFLASTGERRRELLRRVRQTAERLIGAGFKVIVDLHPVSLNPDYAPGKLVVGIGDATFKAYADLVEEMARDLHTLPHDRLAFELMNEPELASDAEMARWQSMQELLHAHARLGSPTLALVLTGALWGNASALMKIDVKPFASSNVIYTFHYYDPHTFTHQGVEGDEGAFLSGLHWNVSPANIADVRTRALNAIDAVKPQPGNAQELKAVTTKLLNDYELTGHNREVMQSDFSAVATWAKAHGIPRGRILLGEFGCVDKANGQPLGSDRGDWIRAVRETAEASGFAWALWAYKGYGGMGLFQDNGQMDEQIAKALDLKR